MILKIVSFTDEGRKTENLLKQKLPDEIWISRQKDESLSSFVRDAFSKRLPIVFVSAAGIAVREISPFVRDKLSDSPVLVIDERGSFVIPILSGHFGGANEIAKMVAEKIGAVPVITTATDVEGKFAVDVFARKNQLKILNRASIKKVSAKILKGEKLSLWVNPKIEVGEDLQKNPLKNVEICHGELVSASTNKNFLINKDSCLSVPLSDCDFMSLSGLTRQSPDIVIDFEQNLEPTRPASETQSSTLFLSPKTLCVGIGCKKGKTFEELKDFLFATLNNEFRRSDRFSRHSERSEEPNKEMFRNAQHDEKNVILNECEESLIKVAQYDISNIASISSIDIKKNEIGLLILAQFLNVPFLTFSAEELKSAKGDFSKSDFVEKVTGVSNVCERAAVLAAGDGAKLLLRKTSSNGMTIAIAEKIPEIKTW